MTNDKWLLECRKRENICGRTLKGRALLVIDYLLSEIGSEDPLLTKIYCIAHCASGVCENKHEGWKQETEELYQKLIGGKE